MKKKSYTKDEIDHQFRWKAEQEQDIYVATEVPFSNAKVYAALCKEGRIHYCLREESSISSNQIWHHVVPNIK